MSTCDGKKQRYFFVTCEKIIKITRFTAFMIILPIIIFNNKHNSYYPNMHGLPGVHSLGQGTEQVLYLLYKNKPNKNLRVSRCCSKERNLSHTHQSIMESWVDNIKNKLNWENTEIVVHQSKIFKIRLMISKPISEHNNSHWSFQIRVQIRILLETD